MGLQLLLLLVCVLAPSCRGQQLSSNQVYKTRRLPGLDVCGKGILNFDEKIINGKPAELGAYPWMANIGYTRTPDGERIAWNCAGSLITDQYVVTAAHCVHPSVIRTRSRTLYVKKVRLGELDLNPNVQDDASPTDYDIEKITYHDYSNTRKENDIALIKLKDKVTFTRLIRPICLPPPEFHENLYLGFFPVVAGWGTTVMPIPGRPKPSGPADTRLLEAEVEIKDTDGCRRNVTSVSELRSAVIDHRVICASSPGKDACQGDSGGPLMLLQTIKRPNSSKLGNYFLMGIVSYGYGCAYEGFPGVYTRVSEYMSWLLDNMDI